MAAPTYSFENALTAKSWVPVVAGVDISPSPIGLWVGSGGSLVLVDAQGNSVEFKNVPAGTSIRCAPIQVDASSTAADIVALFG